MKRLKYLGIPVFVLAGIFLFSSQLFSQTVADYTIQVSAVAQTSPPILTMSWPLDPNATAYYVYRKLKTSPSWGSVIKAMGLFGRESNIL